MSAIFSIRPCHKTSSCRKIPLGVPGLLRGQVTFIIAWSKCYSFSPVIKSGNVDICGTYIIFKCESTARKLWCSSQTLLLLHVCVCASRNQWLQLPMITKPSRASAVFNQPSISTCLIGVEQLYFVRFGLNFVISEKISARKPHVFGCVPGRFAVL